MDKRIPVLNGGKCLPVIIPALPSVVEQNAAEELRSYIEKASCKHIEIETENVNVKRGIYLGHTEYAKQHGIRCTSDEQWYIKESNGSLIISGGTNSNDRGVLYGVFHFLEEQLGIRWWNYWEEYVPKVNELSIPVDYFHSGQPRFRIRQISDIYYKRDLGFISHLRQQGDCGKPQFSDDIHEFKKWGGFVYGGGPDMVHTTHLYIPASEYFADHPDWFAWDEKFQERIPNGQHCFSNEELVHEMSNKVIQAIEQDIQKAEQTGINLPAFFSISLEDCNGQCECERCRDSERKSGRSGHVLKFVNKIAKEVSMKYPNVMLETLAYMLYDEPPLDDTVPEKNVYIRLADIFVDLLHDLQHKNNANQLRRLRQWATLCKKSGSQLIIWDYLCYQFPFYPMPIIFKYFENFRIYNDLDIAGFLIENHEVGTNGMWTMQEWILAKLMENPQLDRDQLLDDFIYKYYGDAGDYVKKYFHLIHKASELYSQRVILYISSSRVNYLDLDTILTGLEYLEKALACVKGNEVLENRIKILRADLDKTIVLRYKDLKRETQRRNIQLPITRSEAVDRVLAVYDILEKTYMVTTLGEPVINTKIELERRTFSERREEESEPVLPDELSDIDVSNIYDISVCDILRFDELYGMNPYQRGRGAINVKDSEASDGRAHKLCYDQMNITSKKKYGFSSFGELPDVPMEISVKRTSVWNDENAACLIRIYRDDLKPNQYALYSLKGIKGVAPGSDSTLSFVEPDGISLDLSSVSQIIPAEEYDVYLRMKFTGSIYGGNANDENAIYLDRIYVVRIP